MIELCMVYSGISIHVRSAVKSTCIVVNLSNEENQAKEMNCQRIFCLKLPC